MKRELLLDAMIIGAGPAGLSAALWLGRCGRRVRVFDSGQPRNAASPALHGYLSRDGYSPWDLRERGREELRRYSTVDLRDLRVRTARRIVSGFVVETTDGSFSQSRLLLLATGREDTLPTIPGVREFYGRGIFHCPYCDGWEHRGRALGVLGHDQSARNLADLLTTWSRDLRIFTHGQGPAPAVAESGHRVVTTRVTGFGGGPDARLRRLQFADGTSEHCDALFFCSNCSQQSDLPEMLGCAFTPDGSVVCHGHAATNVPGLFVAGNVRGGIHLAIMAAAEGAEAALAMNEWLLDLTRPRRRPPVPPRISVARETARG